MPRLSALYRQWAKHPPVHLLVASYLGYDGESAPTVDRSPPDAEAPEAADSQAFARMAGLGSLPPSEALRDASTPMEALAAMERMVFGNVLEL